MLDNLEQSLIEDLGLEGYVLGDEFWNDLLSSYSEETEEDLELIEDSEEDLGF